MFSSILKRSSQSITRHGKWFSTTSTTSNGLVKIENVGDKISVVTMDRAPVNSLNTLLLNDLHEAVSTLEASKDCEAMILTSSSKSVFSAGLDMTEFYKPKDVEDVRTFWRSLQDLYIKYYTTPLATVAALNGQSPAGGCFLAITSDYRVAVNSEKVLIGLNEAQFGLVAPFWFAPPLAACVGDRVAEKMLQRGELVGMETAHRLGLVDQLVEPEALLESAISEAKLMMKAVPSCRAETKTMLRGHRVEALRAVKEDDVEWFVEKAMSDDVQARLEAYMVALKNRKKK